MPEMTTQCLHKNASFAGENSHKNDFIH